ncbi:MAG TPA: pentapeptide repeat-containing protein, partial [Denitromonas sp.]|nr:pentapeptide repeat-containing protein [Denitromonas sp.]
SSAILRGTRLGGASLRAANFRQADLTDADFSHATITQADFTGVKNLPQTVTDLLIGPHIGVFTR